MPPAQATILEILVPSTQEMLGPGAGPSSEIEDLHRQLIELLSLSDADWVQWLAGAGFAEDDVREFEDFASSLFDEIGFIGRFCEELREIDDLGNGVELAPALLRCISPMQQAVLFIALTGRSLSSPVAALALVTRHVIHAADTAVWIESARRRGLEEPELDFTMTDEEIAEGVALAELGLAQDVAEWPPY